MNTPEPTVTDISIVIPAYNEEGAIAAGIREIDEALKGCSFEYEIIVVDDGSTDRTAELARAAERVSDDVRHGSADAGRGDVRGRGGTGRLVELEVHEVREQRLRRRGGRDEQDRDGDERGSERRTPHGAVSRGVFRVE